MTFLTGFPVITGTGRLAFDLPSSLASDLVSGCAAALILDDHKRGAFIRSYAEIEKNQSRGASRKDSGK